MLKLESLEKIKILSFLVIIFLSYMVYYSLFRLKFANLYGLYPKESDGPSLMFATINFSRVAVALIINFFDMLKMESIFTKSMNVLDMGIIGDWAIKGMPGVLWFIVFGHLFNVWDRIAIFVGLQWLVGFKKHLSGSQNQLIPYLVRRKREELEAQH